MNFGNFLRLVPQLFRTLNATTDVIYVTYHLSIRNIYTCDITKFRFDKMAVAHGERVLVHLKNNDSDTFRKGDFTESIVDHIDMDNKNGVCQCTVELKDNKLHISPSDKSNNSSIKMKRPPFCPVHHLTVDKQRALPPATLSRGIDCGAAVILESGDGLVFLTRRGDHLRTFPGIWVPPGGHIEQNETLHEAGLRELKEETGLTITIDMCEKQTVRILAVWESVFPPKLSLGDPKRHHAVIYLHAKLKPEFTAESLRSKVKIDPAEVGACAWFDKTNIEYIVSAKEDAVQDKLPEDVLHSSFSAICLDDDKNQTDTKLPFKDLLKTAGDKSDEKGRVSTGTKFALEEWLVTKQ